MSAGRQARPLHSPKGQPMIGQQAQGEPAFLGRGRRVGHGWEPICSRCRPAIRPARSASPRRHDGTIAPVKQAALCPMRARGRGRRIRTGSKAAGQQADALVNGVALSRR
jgi:hypothetical protein